MFDFLTSFLNLWLVFILGGVTGGYPRECKVTIFVVVLFFLYRQVSLLQKEGGGL